MHNSVEIHTFGRRTADGSTVAGESLNSISVTGSENPDVFRAYTTSRLQLEGPFGWSVANCFHASQQGRSVRSFRRTSGCKSSLKFFERGVG
jgi:hypothetical protein